MQDCASPFSSPTWTRASVGEVALVSTAAKALWPIVLLLITACGNPARQPASTQVLAAAEARQHADAADTRIPCAHRNAPLARTCTVDRTTDDRGLILTLRHPDGRFHRLLVTHDGRGVVAADGAGYALVSIVRSDGIEVTMGGDRYHLPTTIGTPAS